MDEIYIQRCFDLAVQGLGSVAPNPMVGSVIVKDNNIIGEGYHKNFGGPHAEVNAIHSVQNQELLEGSTVYVNLEPCSHFGKTPPCADLLIEKKVAKVVCSNGDPNPLVAGKGFGKLRAAGIEVIENVFSNEGRWLNRRFFTFIEKQRPYIILKFAETTDGFIARSDFSSKWISNEISRTLVHKWRTEEAAILVGYQTALHDNPALTSRQWTGKNPVRCVIDKDLTLSSGHLLLDQSTPTIVFNQKKNEQIGQTKFMKLDTERPVVNEIVEKLATEKLSSLIVEGGSKTISAFLESDLWDEIRVFKSKVTFGSGIKAPQIRGNLVSREYIAGDEVSLYLNNYINT